MTYAEIFDEVVSIMKTDSATCKDMGAGAYAAYREQIRDDMTEREFTLLVKRYLASFGLEGHLGFFNNKLGKIDFEVMRYGDSLYVTRASETSKLKVKDRIVAIDRQTVPAAAAANAAFLMDETDERQGFLWTPILTFAHELTLVRNGERRVVPIELGDGIPADSKYFCHELGDHTVLMRLEDFADEDAVRRMYGESRELLEKAENLVIDVRNNGGGSDTAFFPLLAYCFPEGKMIDDFLPETEPVAINYSKRNCESRLAMLRAFFAAGVADDVRPVAEQMKAELEHNAGKGFIACSGDEETGIYGKAYPRKVWIMTDQDCASSGDAFVEIMSHSPKVTVAGRPTRGITDYSNCALAAWDHYEMIYPTSRDGRIDKGMGLEHRGVQVDHYIPWTPEHLERDVDLEFVMGLIGGTV
ncbi:MAG: S41 family peptidase [Oscillospiraceae bacterium]